MTAVPGPSEQFPPTGSSPATFPPSPDGLVLAPFRALRYDAATAGDLRTLTSPPYDVIDDDERAALEASSEHNIVRVILPRDTADGGDDRYAGAAELLAAWRSAGVLVPDREPALYVYEQATPGGHVQRGLLGALALTRAEDGIVLPHENTMAGPVRDRLALYEAVGGDLEPIFLLYDGGGAATEAVAAAGQREALLDAELPDGHRHRLWAITNDDELTAVATDLRGRTAVIADGHHRYATYLQRQQALHAERGPGPWDFGLTFLVDAGSFGPEVHPIHRVVPGLPARGSAARAASRMRVSPIGLDVGAAASLESAGRPAFVVADDDGAWLLDAPDAEAVAAALPPERSDAWRGLDVSVLHGFVVPVLWGLEDTVDAVAYEHDEAAARAHARRTGGAAVLMAPTPPEAVAAVAAAGERMPRKSTLFTPKPRTGVVLRDYRDA